MSTKKTSSTGIFIGRFQPFHDGHRACIEHILGECDRCVVALRDTERSPENPFGVEERRRMIEAAFPGEEVEVVVIPDVETVYFGRDVGYNVIRLDAEIEAVSATAIRRAAN